MPAPRCLLPALVAVAVVALAPAVARAAEAEVGATGTPFRGADASGAVRGWVDAHLHITANQRAGGRVLYGEPFDPRGIEAALGDDAAEHGPDGSADITGNLLRSGLLGLATDLQVFQSTLTDCLKHSEARLAQVVILATQQALIDQRAQAIENIEV